MFVYYRQRITIMLLLFGHMVWMEWPCRPHVDVSVSGISLYRQVVPFLLPLVWIESLHHFLWGKTTASYFLGDYVEGRHLEKESATSGMAAFWLGKWHLIFFSELLCWCNFFLYVHANHLEGEYLKICWLKSGLKSPQKLTFLLFLQIVVNSSGT